MKKAVAHLIPFMEEEREALFKLSGEQVQESVGKHILKVMMVHHFRKIGGCLNGP